MTSTLHELATLLRAHFGPLHGPSVARPWWPIYGGDASFELLVGAVLVQQTRWETVEAAILRLIAADLLVPAALAAAPADELAALIRPVAFHCQKAPGLIAIANHIAECYNGSTAAMLARPTSALRTELLALPRIGPETCDVIMLYGGGHAIFVIDEYTRRLLERVRPVMHHATRTMHHGEPWRRPYDELRLAIEAELADPYVAAPSLHDPSDLYAELHAQINEACVRYCLARPRCDGPPARRVYSRQEGRESYHGREDGCPLRPICRYYTHERGVTK